MSDTSRPNGQGTPNGQQAPGYPQQPPTYPQQPPAYGQQAPYTQQPGYGQYGYPQPPRTNVLAIIALIAAFVFSPAAIVCGHIARKQIRQTGEQGDGLALTGLILGYVFTGIAIAVILIYIIVIVAVLGTAGAAGAFNV